MVHQSTTHDRLVDLLKAHPRLICELWERETGRELRDQISAPDDEAAALRRPAHAILAAVLHAESDRVAELAELAVIALGSLPAWRRSTYLALLQETLPEDIVDEILERLAKEALDEAEREMRRTRPWRSGHREGLAEGLQQGLQRGIEHGKLEALREAVWLIVELRGLAIDEDERARLEACRDSDQLHRWLIRLKTVERFADALGD